MLQVLDVEENETLGFQVASMLIHENAKNGTVNLPPLLFNASDNTLSAHELSPGMVLLWRAQVSSEVSSYASSIPEMTPFTKCLQQVSTRASSGDDRLSWTFVYTQMLHIGTKLDFQDEMGRRALVVFLSKFFFKIVN